MKAFEIFFSAIMLICLLFAIALNVQKIKLNKEILHELKTRMDKGD